MKKIIFILCLVIWGFVVKADHPKGVVGGIFNLTGDQALLDVPSFNGFKLAFDTILESQNPILNNLKLNLVDGKSDQAFIAQTAKNFFQIPELFVMIGLSDTDKARSVARQARLNKKIFITPGVTSPLLTIEFPIYTFFVAFGDNAQAAAAAEYAIRTLKLDRCAVLYDADMDYTRLIGEYFADSFEHLGGTILLKKTYAHHQLDIENALDQIKELKPAMIYLAAGPENVKPLIGKIRAAGINLPIFGGDSYDTPTFSAEDTDVYYTTHVFLDPHSNDPDLVKFMQAYKKKYGVDPDHAFAALGYDACNLLATVLQKIDSYNPEALLRGLNETRNFKGITGEISYTNARHVPQKPVTIVRILQGNEQQVARFLPEYVPPAHYTEQQIDVKKA